MPGIGTVNGVGFGSGSAAGTGFEELPFPSVIGLLSTLVALNVGNGGFAGSLPSSWSALTLLTSLSFGGDLNAVGTLPAAWAHLPALQSLDISGTGITDALPALWSALGSLTSVRISGDPGLSGGLPPAWSALTTLMSLDLSSDRALGGPLPAAYSTLSLLTYLNISNCGITWQLPVSYSALTSLQPST